MYYNPANDLYRNRKIPYTPLNQLETRSINKVGVVLLVVGTYNHQVWVIEEKKAKQSTGKESGQIGVPAETRKQGEFICDNVRGALTEEMGIGEKHPARNSLFYIDGTGYKGRYQFVTPQKEVHADVVMLVYTGDTNVEFNPQSGEFGTDEVNPTGWMKLEDLQHSKNIRPGLQYILKAAVDGNWIAKLTEQWQLHQNGKDKQIRSVFTPGVAENNRNTSTDIGGFDSSQH